MRKRQRPSLQDLLQERIQTLATVLRPATIAQYRCDTKRFLSYLSTNHPKISRPAQLRRDPHITGWLRSLCEERPPLANKTRRSMIINVRRLLHDLADCNHPPREDLIVSGDCPPHDKYLPKPLSLEDDRLLEAQLHKRATLRSNAFLLIRATGMRIGECLTLSVDSLRELGPGQWAIHVPLGKLHSERWVPIDDEGRTIFRNILALRYSVPSPVSANSPPMLLLQKNARPPSYTVMREELINAAREAGCSVQPTPHQLRHTYATAMLRAGVSLPALKELLGHRSIAMTMIYVEVSQIDLQREYYRARQRMAELHSIPKVEGALKTSLPTLAELLIKAQHLMELRRRELSDNPKKRKLTQLKRRLVDIALRLNLLDAD